MLIHLKDFILWKCENSEMKFGIQESIQIWNSFFFFESNPIL